MVGTHASRLFLRSAFSLNPQGTGQADDTQQDAARNDRLANPRNVYFAESTEPFIVENQIMRK
jgi:hypothetical protein